MRHNKTGKIYRITGGSEFEPRSDNKFSLVSKKGQTFEYEEHGRIIEEMDIMFENTDKFITKGKRVYSILKKYKTVTNPWNITQAWSDHAQMIKILQEMSRLKGDQQASNYYFDTILDEFEEFDSDLQILKGSIRTLTESLNKIRHVESADRDEIKRILNKYTGEGKA